MRVVLSFDTGFTTPPGCCYMLQDERLKQTDVGIGKDRREWRRFRVELARMTMALGPWDLKWQGASFLQNTTHYVL
jgi:hypothetical protein